MPLTSYDPFTREFDRLAQRVFGTTNGGAQRRSVIAMDSIRRKDEVELRFDLPGIDPESIEVTVDKVFPLDEAPDAHRYLQTGHARGKVVLVP